MDWRDRIVCDSDILAALSFAADKIRKESHALLEGLAT